MHSLASRKGHEMVLAFPVLVVGVIGVVCALLGCAVPFAAISAAAALNCGRRCGLSVVLAAWAIDQFLGFTLRGYPHATSTYVWGLAIGVATVASYALASMLRRSAYAAFAGSFVAFEGVLMLFSIPLGDWGAYAPAILVTLLVTNMVWFVAAHALCRVVSRKAFAAPI
ncbi:MAG TPA: hypothetical protein VNF68_10895 [Candidatus Baltobacteraceae bacterium]|nr:hypothetical protein [Candidatus Baltobacteraceae bacterium]